jgi:hypothetical protein
VFATKKTDLKPSSSKQPKNQEDSIPHHSLPKIHFPKFDGTNPKIWFDNFSNYFTIYSIQERLKVIAATMHLEGNASKWWQAYKQNHTIPT